jgi:hypothetical protein
VRYLNVDSFVAGSPIEELWQRDAVVSSRFVVSHLGPI